MSRVPRVSGISEVFDLSKVDMSSSLTNAPWAPGQCLCVPPNILLTSEMDYEAI